MGDKALVRNPGEGEAFWMLDSLYEVLASGDETGGAHTTMRMTIPPGMGPPPHRHSGAESVYVLEGSIRYHIAGETYDGQPGSYFNIPAGVLENFEPAGDEPIKLLVVYSPGGAEKFFAEAGEPAQRRELPPPSDSPPDIARLVEIAARHGMEIIAPAPA